jgi:Carbohydrate esterase, sialic acid-specific acetylesterase
MKILLTIYLFVITSQIYNYSLKVTWRRHFIYLHFIFTLFVSISCSTTSNSNITVNQANRTKYFPKNIEILANIPPKQNIWVFVMAGQSNMAGRGFVEPKDTMANERILTINKHGEITIAKEPLHFYEPNLTGLDCGLSFANAMLKKIPKDISILLIPAAIGGSSAGQWLGDSLYRGVNLMTNFKEKVAIGQKYGTIKAMLWHQGESDANIASIPVYRQKINTLFTHIRRIIGNEKLPILVGELGAYSTNPKNWEAINNEIRANAAEDKNIGLIRTFDLKEKGDQIHFDAEGQRKMGKRFADAYFRLF